MVIQSPPGWGWDQIRLAANQVGSARPEEYWREGVRDDIAPMVRSIGVADLRDALARGLADFQANRTDVIFLCVIYPIIGIVLGRVASGYGLLPLLFPLASGFALIGPLAAVGLNEMSRRREQGDEIGWVDAFGVMHAPSIGAIALLGVLLIGLFLLWLVLAQVIYVETLGPAAPASAFAFFSDVFTTRVQQNFFRPLLPVPVIAVDRKQQAALFDAPFVALRFVLGKPEARYRTDNSSDNATRSDTGQRCDNRTGRN